MRNGWLRFDLPSVEEILSRLKTIFPREIDTNGYIAREIGARTVFVMLYGFCVEEDSFIRPATITCMTDKQAALQSEEERRNWLSGLQSRKQQEKDILGKWYMPNTRECIRDETLREMVRLNAVVERKGLPTTSPSPRYSLQREFADLFNPSLETTDLDDRIEQWRRKYLKANALARTALSKNMASNKDAGVLVTLPNGESRKLSPGPSSLLIKAVIEEFTKHFLINPAVVLISESSNKILLRDDTLCRAIGLNIDPSSVLPDIILVELDGTEPIIVFVECVATDGPINERRKEGLEILANEAGYQEGDYTFVTVFKDRAGSESRKLNFSIAWGTFIWYATEPESIIYLHEGNSEKKASLKDLLEISQSPRQ